ncbi:hypothetical protein JHK86_021701 [Glycine max]|nr:hypothetical protein JHK86_021701 [Glycine max]
MITDNEINSFIVQPLKQGVTLHAIIDACHSGTTLDLCIFAKRKSAVGVGRITNFYKLFQLVSFTGLSHLLSSDVEVSLCMSVKNA